MPRTLILGIGNTLLTDEGVGVYALHALHRQFGHLPDLDFLDGGTLSFTLAGAIEEADHLIVLDAAELNAEPGVVHTFEDAAMDGFLGAARRSVHEVGLIDLMDIARLTEHVPHRRALIGIQPHRFEWGETPSPELIAALPRVKAEFRRLLESWGCLKVAA
ncbi:MAG: HyaD/HybD family hydrogenase maturation endopeptidase [Gammaproteobacteria bacterium]|nr:HyaD/HybD family hydrogenase maturation endopeptidase [Gammaproteobacteria bacterium]